MKAKALSIKPTHEHIILEDCEVTKTTSSGIVLTTFTEDLKQRYAIVVAVGKGVRIKKSNKFIPPAVKEGEKVLYDIEGATKIKIEGRNVVIVKESNIIGVAED